MVRKSVAVGGALAALLLVTAAVPADVLGAASPAGGAPGTPGLAASVGTGVGVSALQAALIAFGYYLANSPWLFGLAFFTLYRPLVAGFFVGLILGDPAQGTLIGAAINVPYLGFISAGGNLPVDPSFAGWVGTTIALANGIDPLTAIGISFGLGLIGTIIFYGRMALDSVFAHWADARAEKADIGGVALMNWLPGQTFLFVASFVPVFILALNGPSAVQDALNSLPLWAVNGLIIAGGILPAIGIALNMRFIFRGAVIPYFFVGFILWMSMNDPATSADDGRVLITIAVLGAALASLHLTFVRPMLDSKAGVAATARAADAQAPSSNASLSAGGPAAEGPAAEGPAGGAPGSGGRVSVTRGDLLKSWALWTFFAHANYNYERLQGTGFAHAMTPVIRRLYKTEDEIRAALKRHLVFFNTEPNLGNIVHGTVIAMEEQRANGAEIDDDAINAVKSGLMGPLAGIGDTLSQATITPILLALGIGIAGGTASGTAVPTISGTTGNPLGAIIYMVLIAVIIVAIGYTAWMQGYARGRSFVTDLLRSGAIDRILVGAGVLGNLVLGALAAEFIAVNLAPTISIAGARMNLQASILDPLFPGLLPLALVLLTWWLLRRVNPLALVVAYLVFAIVAAYPFFGPGQANAGDYSYQACTSSLLHQYSPCGAPPSPSPAPAASEPAASPGASTAP
jgi:mannose/fructose/N-acetylgalactosamine-specific phosphotransferase system component IID/mannose/fructose/N-acetylgalactosamine-specific phosphotransferase system component IIC